MTQEKCCCDFDGKTRELTLKVKINCEPGDEGGCKATVVCCPDDQDCCPESKD